MKTKKVLLLPILSLFLLTGCGNNSASSQDFDSEESHDLTESENSSSSSESDLKPDSETKEYDYYFDSSNTEYGDGTYQNPYYTLDAIGDIELRPGSTIYLKAGSVFSGSLHLENVSGTKDEPITVTSYGEGKAEIDGSNLSGSGVVRLHNCNNVTVKNLEIYDSFKDEGDRRGVLVTMTSQNENEVTTYENITLDNLYIHDIYGYSDEENSGMGMFSKKTGGIALWSEDGKAKINGYRVTNCKIDNICNCGIMTFYFMTPECQAGGGKNPYSEEFINYAFENVYIGHNEISHVGKNALFLRNLEKGVIEYNKVSETALKCNSGNQIVTANVNGTLIQYNEGSFNRAKPRKSDGKLQDGAMLDADINSKDTIWQYNYSHDNTFGLFINCTVVNPKLGIYDKATVRYNLSVNDKGEKGLFYVNYVNDGMLIHNNTFITSKNSKNLFCINKGRTASIYNNIFYNRSSDIEFTYSDQTVMGNNLFYSEKGASIANIDKLKTINKNGIYEDPLFVGPIPEIASNGLIESAIPFKVKSISPVFNKGYEIIEMNDYFNNPYRNAIGFYTGEKDIDNKKEVD